MRGGKATTATMIKLLESIFIVIRGLSHLQGGCGTKTLLILVLLSV